MIWTTLQLHFLPILASVAENVSPQSADSSILPTLLAACSNVFTGVLTYVITMRKFNKQSTRRDIDDLIAANKAFREEIQKELDQAKAVIDDLKKQSIKKDQDMLELQSSIASLKNQVSIRETSISELNTQIMKRDLKIADLENRINKMASASS